jgi:hypothetical protein
MPAARVTVVISGQISPVSSPDKLASVQPREQDQQRVLWGKLSPYVPSLSPGCIRVPRSAMGTLPNFAVLDQAAAAVPPSLRPRRSGGPPYFGHRRSSPTAPLPGPRRRTNQAQHRRPSSQIMDSSYYVPPAGASGSGMDPHGAQGPGSAKVGTAEGMTRRAVLCCAPGSIRLLWQRRAEPDSRSRLQFEA